MVNGLAVVVKRMSWLTSLRKDEFHAKMRRFGALNHNNILTPLAYHCRKEEKLIVSEYMPKGSLSYVLLGAKDVVRSNLNWPTRLKIIKGIAQGLSFIHKEFAIYEVPHGNLKSSNVLLSENYDPLLSDYNFQILANPNHVAQALFAYKSPEYIQYQQVPSKSDVFCLGIIILEIMTGKVPSQYLSNNDGGIDIMQWVQTLISEDCALELIDPEIAKDESSIDSMLQVLELGASCVESNPDKRLHLNEVVTRIEEVS
ncbi:Pollen receptor-like kinase 3 [Hibiscus syriacus]|uniref:Pollen receptor-like kinase 3 n=1 Tax=Hibiscus syriacus TaxID=106335 RepID=A0A6A3C7H2_HIBSY|nr:Pollen receptor-like kinase 3 [Hibiscus syriacus]